MGIQRSWQSLVDWLGKAHRCCPQWDTISQTTSDHGQHQAKDGSHHIKEPPGLRGVRVGEASHPGPPRQGAPCADRVPEEVLNDLEAALTRIDSSGTDDEPLMRPSSGSRAKEIHDRGSTRRRSPSPFEEGGSFFPAGCGVHSLGDNDFRGR